MTDQLNDFLQPETFTPGELFLFHRGETRDGTARPSIFPSPQCSPKSWKVSRPNAIGYIQPITTNYYQLQ